MAREKYTFTKEELEISTFNILDYLKTDEDMAGYLEACLAEGGVEAFFMGLGDVIQAKGIAQISRETGLSREEVYKTFEPGRQPHFETIWKITKALGLNVSIGCVQPPAAKSRLPGRRRKREAVTTE